MTAQPPPAAGVRLPWSDLPPRIPKALEGWLRAPLATVAPQTGGFSPGVAARVRTTDGRRVFVKAVGPELNPDTPNIFRQEARIVGALGSMVQIPVLHWVYDEGPDAWIMLVFQDIEGWNPVQPWRGNELERVLDALMVLADALTPSPLEAPLASEIFASHICGWGRLRENPLPGLDEWSIRHLTSLATLESEAVYAVSGDTLLHFDVRADNVLLTADRVYFVDWPNASRGAAWVDIVLFAPSVAMHGALQPEEMLARYPAAREADPDAITAAVASFAGYLTQRALLPPPPGLPTIRAFQAAQGVEARRWLAQRTGWM